MPLNIDWQQILLHWMNLAILAGGLYILLYKPVKQFMDKRAEYYRELDRQAAEKLEQAGQLRAEAQARLDGMDEELRQVRARAQQSAQQAAQEQVELAQAQAQRIVAKAQAEAEQSRERAIRESQRELRELAAKATQKLAFQTDPFDQFLDLAEEEEEHEG